MTAYNRKAKKKKTAMSAIFKKKTFLIQLNVCSKSSSWKTTSKNWKQNVITIKLENLTLNVCKSNLKFNDNGILSAPLQTRCNNCLCKAKTYKSQLIATL